MPPGMGMASGGRPQWQPSTSTPMNYSSSSPGNYGVSRDARLAIARCKTSQLRPFRAQGPPGGGPPGPGTPIMPSPQGKYPSSSAHSIDKVVD